ncbi:uncharacterized protein LOC122664593 [Telopea speciosissima]|uniref:uncharacterized protein LOC122664593 n=1 Tax=Telopea speciosissima TaxID=54955 RepID=UPI001CC49CB9|nr:uncharacterized protein LOC122664593 [Telopea speciosissima]XP_043716415.1 uncharacterized protein LOC122664593 [Telopea speciosissima]XP_043716417.1 uncharacterized protein LOC122664593 [Telopea speciosissima]XP_043716418.1 uncharacterized protein LOC122664593 [Telopea speciosissima]XP_043716419.1 uncharacterized protein LOC122664593 [Telopea speciosissima]
MVMTQACKLNLPLRAHPSSSLEINSLLFEPISQSLALMYSDSSFLLLPSPPIFTSSPSPSFPPSTLIPSPSTSACFVRLHASPNSTDGRVLFIVAGPHSGGSSILLRSWILRKNQASFAKTQVSCSRSGLSCDHRLGVVVDLSHGFSVKLAGSVNVFALHSVSARKIFVFAAKMIGDEDDGVGVHLVKCAVIDCTLPICSMTILFGFLLLGEDNGVRVFPLRPLVKGRVHRQQELARRRDRKLDLPNGSIQTINGINDLYSTKTMYSKHLVSGTDGNSAEQEGTTVSTNGYAKAEAHRDSAKLRTVKVKQDSSECGTCFVSFKDPEVQSSKSTTLFSMPVKAAYIHALSPNKFLILDMVGDLHLLWLYNTVLGSEIKGHMRHLNHSMKVQMLAVLPDISMRTQTVWVSDGFHSVHTMSISDMDIPANEDVKNDVEEKQIQISAIQAIFASEKIQDIVPLAANAILILGQGNIFAYAIS